MAGITHQLLPVNVYSANEDQFCPTFDSPRRRAVPHTMFRIHRESEGHAFVTFSLSGRIQSEQVAELRTLLQSEHRRVVLDLQEVTLVDRDAVQFLRLCESHRTQLRNCPAYVHEWIIKERFGGHG